MPESVEGGGVAEPAIAIVPLPPDAAGTTTVASIVPARTVTDCCAPTGTLAVDGRLAAGINCVCNDPPPEQPAPHNAAPKAKGAKPKLLRVIPLGVTFAGAGSFRTDVYGSASENT